MLRGDAANSLAVVRPPGHHASRDQFGGYCYLNNAAIAAAQLLAAGTGRVAVVDVDYHHGNGTQDIFYDRDDVYFCSLHADPAQEYPYFLGYANETGSGAGAGCNFNMPLPRGTGFDVWREALRFALRRVAQFRAAALVVSLGLDTFEGDPISGFRLKSRDYLSVGGDIARAGLPTVFVFEGGYAVAQLGVNAINVLEGFERQAA